MQVSKALNRAWINHDVMEILPYFYIKTSSFE